MSERSVGHGADLLALKEQVVAVMELLATRMQWSSGKVLLNNAGIHVSRGWTETIAHAKADLPGEGVLKLAYEKLSSAALWHTYVGNKRVNFFDLRFHDKATKEKIIRWATDSALGDLSEILEKRPFDILFTPADHDDLKQYESADPILLSAEFSSGKLYLQYFSTRAYSHRDSFAVQSLPEGPAKYFGTYQEVIGVRTRLVPCFDTVVIDTKNDLIEFRIDFAPGLHGDKDMTSFETIIKEFNRLTLRYIGDQAAKVGILNLYPVIEPMYLDAKCGRITALGFVATSEDTSSNNHGQIHRTRTQDFRKDRFHVGGKAHVDKIEPYAIGVTWDRTDPKGNLYLELKGSVRTVYSGKLRSVTTVELLGCEDGADYDFLASQVLRRLPRKKS